MTKMHCVKNLNKKEKNYGKNHNVAKHSPAIKLTITVGIQHLRATVLCMLYITTPFIQSFRADKKEGGKSTQFWLLLEGGKVIRDGLGLYGDKGAFHTLAIVCASQGYSFGLGFGF